MDAFNRAFAGIVALVWCAAMAALLVMVWSPTRAIDIEADGVTAYLNLAMSSTNQVIATIILGALILAGLALLVYQLVGPRFGYTDPATRDMYRRLDERVRQLEGRVGHEVGASEERTTDSAPVEARTSDAPRRWSFTGRRG